MKLGSTPTGAIVNFARLCVLALGLIFVILSLVILAVTVLSNQVQPANWRLYSAAGAFIAGAILIAGSTFYQVESHPWLMSNVLHDLLEQGKPIDELESFIRTFKGHIGIAGFFNRLGFSGLSLGTIAAAFGLLVVGLIAIATNLLPPSGFDAFSDLAKLLFGAFVGSFAPAVLPHGPEQARPAANAGGPKPGSGAR